MRLPIGVAMLFFEVSGRALEQRPRLRRVFRDPWPLRGHRAERPPGLPGFTGSPSPQPMVAHADLVNRLVQTKHDNPASSPRTAVESGLTSMLGGFRWMQRKSS